MKSDRGIIMSAPMVRALLDGTKTQTRRLAWAPYKPVRKSDDLIAECHNVILDTKSGEALIRRPTVWQKVRPGDRLWVRETFYETDKIARIGLLDGKPKPAVYRADLPENEWRFAKWTPAIYIRRDLSRLTLEVTEVRRQRLQEIDGLDALAEGIEREDGVAPWRSFKRLWQSLHGLDSWRENPEVVALTFTVHQANIDQFGEEKV